MIGFKYDYAVNNDYMVEHEKKYMIWYQWKFIDFYQLLQWCMFRWIHMTDEESYQYKGYENEKVVTGSGYNYKGFNPKDDSNYVVDLVEYHVETLPQF